ncbi:YiiX/YebB-like N1pC/P60 family cysteine hydrolase [Bacteroides congonensis]|uniref:YiiX/YebB-like N1pC/P60 family cysteine hydrolase n=1 Tax=Bacteroides congonensis TaxID=1871006 RepID=UPI0026662802|nr:YiiX/YebB-like N1pC/P60 family cysteine hydrolase [Bacteroides congonensis]
MLDLDFKYVFDSSKLQKGDILLMDTYHEKQRQLMPNDKYLHVAVYIGNAMIVEADGLGSTINHVYSYAFKKKDDACVIRVKNFNAIHADKIQRCLREDLGREYSTREALKVKKLKSTNERDTSKQTFCSRNVAKAFERCSFHLVTNPDYCSPDDLMNSDLVELVDDGICEIEDDVRDIVALHIQQRESPDLSVMPQTLFEDVRNFLKSKGLTGPEYNIQNYSDMLLTILKVPEYDSELAELLKNHSCLTDPRHRTKEYWPWFDDDEKFFNHYTDTRDALFFIYNQIDHYDDVYLPTQQENFVSGVFLSITHADLETLKILSEHWRNIYKESIRIRKRIVDLFYKIISKDPRGAFLFQQAVGLPKKIVFEYPILDISRFLLIPHEYLNKIIDYLQKNPNALNPEK